MKEVDQVEFEAEIELVKEELKDLDGKIKEMEDKQDADINDMVLDYLKVKGDPRKYRIKLPGYARSDGRLAKSDRMQNVMKLK